MTGLKGVDQRTAGAEARGRLAGQRPTVIVGRLRLGRRTLRPTFFLFGIAFVAHDTGLPSAREMRTRFWLLPAPNRNSAAANKRSTTM